MGPLFREGAPADVTRLDAATTWRLRALAADRPTGGYEGIHDPVELSLAIRELRRVHAWIVQFAELSMEMPGFALESVLGVKATAAMVMLLIERAEARLGYLTRHSAAAAGG